MEFWITHDGLGKELQKDSSGYELRPFGYGLRPVTIESELHTEYPVTIKLNDAFLLGFTFGEIRQMAEIAGFLPPIKTNAKGESA